MFINEYSFFGDRTIPNTKFGTNYWLKFSVPRNYEELHKIMIKIKYKDELKNIYDINKAIKSIELYIGANLVDVLNEVIQYQWNENNELLIDFNFNYSNGIIVFNECKYFEIVVKVTHFDYYSVDSTKCILHCK
jgi:hypothetical protein